MINGILLIYHHSLSQNAPTIMDHVNSFKTYSKFPVWEVNTLYGFPTGIKLSQFSIVVLHYSLFGSYPFALPERFVRYLRGCDKTIKIAFFQDEYRYCEQRYELIDMLKIDGIFTLLDQEYFGSVYYERCGVKKVLPTLTGYIPEIKNSDISKLNKPHYERKIDVGYRARQLPFFMGRGAQEKTDIAINFANIATGRGLKLNLSNDENSRIYGENWLSFVGNCKFMLGVEAGVTIFDFDGKIERKCEQLTKQDPTISFEKVSQLILAQIDGNVNYRMISPRIFEMATLQTVPLLFRGNYNGIIQPDLNYILIEKDFSNADDVFDKMADDQLVQSIIENNLQLVSKHELSFEAFIASFDKNLSNTFELNHMKVSKGVKEQTDELLRIGFPLRNFLTVIRYKNFFGRSILKRIYHLFNSIKKSRFL
jgi:hypothetical protein